MSVKYFYCYDVLKCFWMCCRMVIITKLFQLCSVRILVILQPRLLVTTLLHLRLFTQWSHGTMTERVMIYAQSAVRISCWK